MKKEEKMLPKATAENAKEYDEITKKVHEGEQSCTDEEYKRLNELVESYDWFNLVFTDAETGKKGLKTVAGEVIVPAIYDDFSEVQSYLGAPHHPAVAIKDGKCGIVKADGSGNQLCEFKFDYIGSIPYCQLFVARWNGEKEHFGIISPNGTIICPNILTGYCEQTNEIMPIKNGDKWGVIDLGTIQCVLPEYDDLDMDVDDPVVFIKDGQRGYITENGEFVTVEQYKKDEKYIDVPVIMTRLD